MFTKTLIREAYEEIKELQVLGKEILKVIALKNTKHLQNFIEGTDKYLDFDDIWFDDAKIHIELYQFHAIRLFASNVKLVFRIKFVKELGNQRAAYVANVEGTYKPNDVKAIDLYIGQKDILNFFHDVYVTQDKLERFLENRCFSSLVHELQHAFDDYRSKSKIFHNQQTVDYFKNNPEDALDNMVDKAFEREVKYLNLPHEIWARFTETVMKLEFFKYLDMKDHPKGIAFEYSQVPLNNVLEQFKRKMIGFQVLPEEMQQKLIKRVASFYHKEVANFDKIHPETKDLVNILVKN